MNAISSKRISFIVSTAIAAIVVISSITACGGGSSSGGGGSGFAGTYNGFATVTLSSPGLASQSSTGTIEFRIDPDGTVTSDPGTAMSGTSKLNGNSFSITLRGNQLQPSGVSCVGTLTLSGSVQANTITGKFSSSNFSCNGIPITWTGTFSATRAVQASVIQLSDPVLDMTRNAIRQLR